MGHLLGASIVGLMTTSSKRSYATRMTQVCCSQSSCPCGRPLLTHTPAGGTQKLRGRSDSVSVVSLCLDAHKVLFEPSKHLWRGWGLILNIISPLLPSCWAPPLALDMGYLFLVGFNILLLMVVQQWFVILELSQKMSAHPYILPSWWISSQWYWINIQFWGIITLNSRVFNIINVYSVAFNIH